MRQEFDKQLTGSGYIHGILLPDESKTAEARLLKKKILHSKSIWDKITGNKWCEAGEGKARLTGDVLRLSVPARTGRWPEGAPEDGDYTFFGQKEVILKFDGENWEEYNRISLKVKPECPGLHSPMITVNLVNNGVQKVPDKYMREGQHIINLKNRVWNSCIWEFPELPRDSVTELKFSIQCFGKEVTTADVMEYDISDIRLDQIADPEVTTGWVCKKDTISYSTTGYWAGGKKTAVANVGAGEFQLIEEKTSQVVFSAKIKSVTNDKGSFSVLDFSEFKQPGRYRLRAGAVITESFEIGHRIMEEAVWKVIHFLYSERCGYPVVGRHGACHGDIVAEHNGVKIVYNGGWHDAGDVSQQTAQTAEVVHALLEMAETVKNNTGGEKDRLLYLRLLEEAQWGLDFVLRMRFGDGYRVSSAGVCRWTNGLIGDMDDVAARVHNHAFENFLMSGIEAFGAIALKEMDPELAWKCLDSAKSDFRFAVERFETAGMEQASMYEHTYNSSLSQYYATASWAASVIYKAANDGYYAKEAEKFADSLLMCQESGTEGIPLKGFFYRDEAKKTIVHFNHQSREQIYMQALELLCRTQKENVKLPQWEKAMKLYGGYIKNIMKYTEPYGMIPAGIHSVDEADDRETFGLLHLLTTYEEERSNYIEQLKNGAALDEKYCVRCFPIWFSFRGNTAVHLAAGKAAALLGNYFNDSELLDIAREQLYWVAGKNPFGQSLIYGEGSNYAQQYCALAGEMVGEIPVGIQTKDNADVPYWPMAGNATYKEVWTTSAGRWLWLAAELYSDGEVME